MFKQAEMILNPVFLILTLLFFFFICLRIRGMFFRKKPRTIIWKRKSGLSYTIPGILKTISLPLMAAGIIYFLFIILIFTAVLYPYIKTFFILVFSAWAILETYMSLSIPKNLPRASIFRRIIHFLTVVICMAGAVFLFPKIIKTYPFPKTSDCVVLDLPVRGEWLAGHAGATTLTNNHYKSKYAIDCLKIGPDGRFFKDPEEKVSDFYSYEEPVYAPANGKITEVVDSLTSDIFGEPDTENLGGNYVILDLGNGKYFLVAHLMKEKIPVEEGQLVKKGDILGYIGNSGNTSFPHLHIHVQNKPTADPEGRITYPFRFNKMKRKRLIFWREVRNAALIRNDRFHD